MPSPLDGVLYAEEDVLGVGVNRELWESCDTEPGGNVVNKGLQVESARVETIPKQKKSSTNTQLRAVECSICRMVNDC